MYSIATFTFTIEIDEQKEFNKTIIDNKEFTHLSNFTDKMKCYS